MDILYNTDVVVGIGFVLFIGVLVYAGVPGLVTKMLDERAEKIRSDIDEARQLREEAQSLLASYERKHKEVEKLTAEIVAKAREDAQADAAKAKDDLADAIERRLAAAKDQIASAEAAAMREVKDQAVTVAVAAARAVIADKMSVTDADAMIDASIKEVGAKLH